MTFAFLFATELFLIPIAAEPLPSSESATNLALLALAGSVLAAAVSGVFLWRSSVGRKYSDTRDDKTAEVQNLKTSAEIAMQLVEEARNSAKDAIAILKDSLATANNQLDSANATIDTLQGTIGTLQTVMADMRLDAAAARAEAERRLHSLEEDLVAKTVERDNFRVKVNELARKLEAKEEEQENMLAHTPAQLHIVNEPER